MSEQAHPDQLPRHRTRRAPASRMSLNVTAMIDVVFLLLIYFLAVTNFKVGEEVYRLDLPQRGSSQQADPFQLDEQPLRITVISMGTAAQPYRLRLDGPYEQPESFAGLFQFLQQRMILPSTSEGLFAQDHPILIEPDAAARWDHVIGAFNAAVRAGYTNVTFTEPVQ